MDNNAIIEYKAFEVELKDIDRSGRHMIGAFTSYNNEDAYGDIGRRGMFTKTWAENFKRIKHLLNHDVTKPIGKIEKLWDDNQYAYYKSKVGTHKQGDDALEMAESGLINEHSYGYVVVRQKKSGKVRELLEVKQLELSSVSGWGVNENTGLHSFAKSFDNPDFHKKMFERNAALEKFCKNSNASDETIELLLLESKQLTQIIFDISNKTTEPDATTLPEWSGKIII